MSSQLAVPSPSARRFRIQARAGAGGSAEVLRAVDLSGATVALKVGRDSSYGGVLAREALLHLWLASPLAGVLRDVGWLAIEADEATVVSADRRDARPFLALSWIEGARPSDGVDSALLVARDVAAALGDLHALGYAHGDVKLDNMLSDGIVCALVDFGLAGPSETTDVSGATMRYLPRCDASLGDARSRDLLGLGVSLAELSDPAIAASDEPVAAARSASLPEPIASICRALLTQDPAARPSARWVSERASAALIARGCAPRLDSDDLAAARARRVRSTYLRVRRHDLTVARAAGPDTAPWLDDALQSIERVRGLDQALFGERTTSELGPMRADEVARFLTSLIGPVAASWPLSAITAASEAHWAPALEALARRREPASWTLQDIERVASGAPAAERDFERSHPVLVTSGDFTPALAADLALAMSRVPVPDWTLRTVEDRQDAPAPLVLAAADALRLSGEHGRALALALRPSTETDDRAPGLRAEILRRAGDASGAERVARDAISRRRDPEGRARATLARIELDRGRAAEAEAIVEGSPARTSTCEIRVLLALSRGDKTAALNHVAEAQAHASTPEERARAAAWLGYVKHGVEPEETLTAYRLAAAHASQAGALVEEATYLSSEAASAVHVGELGCAVLSAERAALLWEHLGRPSRAARARLAIAAAYAAAGAELDATHAAEAAIRLGQAGQDRQASAYAHWAIADVVAAGSDAGVRAARAAALLVDERGEDALRAGARLHRHRVLGRESVESFDQVAAGASEVSAEARLEWWGARAEELAWRRRNGDGPAERPAAIVAALSMLAGAPAPVAARGPALAAGYVLASEIGHGDAARRLMAALATAARELLGRAPAHLIASIRTLPWVTLTHAAETHTGESHAEQAGELEELVRSFGERERLGPLLSRVVDALVLWTGVERGLLLLSAPDGRLVPRAARNLARRDLTGEQLVLSQTLAKRALHAREPVIAVDAAGELPSLHESVHALKLRSVLAVPLIARGEPVGVVYLDDRVRRGAFGEHEIAWTKTIATLAALIIADARDQVLLRRAARRATRLAAKLESSLAEREARLEVAERELAEQREGRKTRYRYDHIVGESEPMRALLEKVDRVTAADVPVLIFGQSGSGKELIARAIHENGARSNRSFVSENCGAIPETLLESTLFGHVRGAFTGADRPRSGLFEVAHEGTLFLDEIGEMSLPMQTKLLRVLEDGLVRPLGSERARKVDTRIVAATHRDLASMVKQGKFREDLFYRLNIISLTIPPLRERPEDIPLLIERLIAKHGAGRAVRVTKAAMDRLIAFSWPGNVRQLENEMRRNLVLCDDVIDREHLSPEIGVTKTHNPLELGLNVRHRVDALEVELVTEALDKTRGNQTQAAKLLGLSRFGLQKMMKRLGLSAER